MEKVKGIEKTEDIGTEYLMAHEVQAVTDKFGFVVKLKTDLEIMQKG